MKDRLFNSKNMTREEISEMLKIYSEGIKDSLDNPLLYISGTNIGPLSLLKKQIDDYFKFSILCTQEAKEILFSHFSTKTYKAFIKEIILENKDFVIKTLEDDFLTAKEKERLIELSHKSFDFPLIFEINKRFEVSEEVKSNFIKSVVSKIEKEREYLALNYVEETIFITLFPEILDKLDINIFPNKKKNAISFLSKNLSPLTITLLERLVYEEKLDHDIIEESIYLMFDSFSSSHTPSEELKEVLFSDLIEDKDTWMQRYIDLVKYLTEEIGSNYLFSTKEECKQFFTEMIEQQPNTKGTLNNMRVSYVHTNLVELIPLVCLIDREDGSLVAVEPGPKQLSLFDQIAPGTLSFSHPKNFSKGMNTQLLVELLFNILIYYDIDAETIFKLESSLYQKTIFVNFNPLFFISKNNKLYNNFIRKIIFDEGYINYLSIKEMPRIVYEEDNKEFLKPPASTLNLLLSQESLKIHFDSSSFIRFLELFGDDLVDYVKNLDIINLSDNLLFMDLIMIGVPFRKKNFYQGKNGGEFYIKNYEINNGEFQNLTLHYLPELMIEIIKKVEPEEVQQIYSEYISTLVSGLDGDNQEDAKIYSDFIEESDSYINSEILNRLIEYNRNLFLSHADEPTKDQIEQIFKIIQENISILELSKVLRENKSIKK